MISIKRKIFESVEFSHPPVGETDNGIEYTINHNMGELPDSCQLYYETAAGWTISPTRDLFDADFGFAWTAYYYDAYASRNNHNTMTVRIARLSGTLSLPVKVKFFKF